MASLSLRSPPHGEPLAKMTTDGHSLAIDEPVADNTVARSHGRRRNQKTAMVGAPLHRQYPIDGLPAILNHRHHLSIDGSPAILSHRHHRSSSSTTKRAASSEDFWFLQSFPFPSKTTRRRRSWADRSRDQPRMVDCHF